MESECMKNMFYDLFGKTENEIRAFCAPGRVNLIGEHIDYCGGAVLPLALFQKTTLLARKRDDDLICMRATDLSDCVTIKISDIENAAPGRFWGDYQIGVLKELLKAGYELFGCDLLYDDTVPHGGGLSSSAAIELSTAFCFALVSDEHNGIKTEPDRIKLAKLSQMAEHNFIGVKCGIMDQFASAMGKRGHAINLNCKTLDYEYIPISLDGYKIVITNTHVKHSLGASEYNKRRAECNEGLLILSKKIPGIFELCDVSEEQFKAFENEFSDDTIKRRVRHVVTECERVNISTQALKKGDIKKFGELMNQSHDSLKNDYEVTCPELDFLVDTAREIQGVIGTRMTGAGFGGCTVSIVEESVVDAFIKTLQTEYKNKFGRVASFYVTEAFDGVREIQV